jgi:hypothetical protein
MVAPKVLIYLLNQITNFCVSVLLLCCSYSLTEITSVSAARLPLISTVSGAWSVMNPTASEALDVVSVLQFLFTSFCNIYGSKLQPSDFVSVVSLPVLTRQEDMKAGPDWLDIFDSKSKHKLEVSQTVSILLGDPEDFGPNSENDPIFCAGQRASVVDLARLYSHRYRCAFRGGDRRN